MSPQYSPMRFSSNQCYPNNQNMSSSSGYPTVGNMGQVWPPVYHPPNSDVSMIRADNMTVEQTAEWVRTLGRYNAWEETDEYAENFKENNIWGVLLPKLTNKTLKDDLGIAKCGHRLEIMLAIKCLFPKKKPSEHFAEEKIPQNDELLRSPMVESAGETGSVKDTTSSIPAWSPSVSSMMVYSQCKGDVEAMEHSSSKKATPAAKLTTPAVNPYLREDPSAKPNWNSDRARPSHPVVYKTLRKAELRSGKSGRAKALGYLPKGSIVVINQIKGRNGRVVFQNKLGRYKTAGWVTLYTVNNQQLMRKYNPKTQDRGFALSSLADVRLSKISKCTR